MKYFIACIFFLLATLGKGQSLRIYVADLETGLPVPGAQVRLMAADTVHQISDALGIAVFEGRSAGKLVVGHISYQNFEAAISATNPVFQAYLTPLKTTLDEVVVTGQASPSLASKAVHKVKVIDKGRIQKQAAVNLKDVLSNELNFRLSEDAILGTQINLQGLSGAKVKILVDGVPVIGRLDGNIDLSQILLNDIERVELVEGPMAVQYGTDAIAGTINLITKRNGNKGFQLGLNTYYESAGRYNTDATSGFSIGKWRTTLSAGRNYFNGFDPNPGNRNLAWNPKEQYFSTVDVQRRWGKLLLRYKTDFFREEIVNQGAVGSMDSIIDPVDTGAWKYPRALDDTYLTHRVNNSLFADYFLNTDMKVNVFAAYNYFRRAKTSTVRNLSTGEEQLFTGTDAQDTSRFGLWASRLFFEHQVLPEKLSYQAGYDLNYEHNQGARIANGLQAITDVALFTTLDYQPVSSITLQPGIRFIYNSQFEAPIIVSLASRFQLVEEWVVRASYGQGFRAPTLKELYFLFVDENHNILGNPELKAERAHNFQVGLTYTRQWTNNLSFKGEASTFYNRIYDEIRLVAVVEPGSTDPRGLYTNRNIAQTETAGGSLSGKLQLAAFTLEPGVSLLGMKNNLAYSSAATETEYARFNWYPQYRLNMSYALSEIGLTPSAFIHHTAQRRDLSVTAEGDLTQQTFAGYTMVDFSLQKSFWKERLLFSAGVKNALNVQNIQVSGAGGTGGAHSSGAGSIPFSYGRSFFVRLQYSFK
jgi:outer membrane receptor for ferrienterochelin and colicins